MNEEASSATHLAWLLRIQVERAWLGNGRVMHCVFAVSKLVLGCWKRAGVNNALFGWVHVPILLSRVSMSIYGPIAGTTDKVSSILVISVVLSRACLECLAALSQTRNMW